MQARIIDERSLRNSWIRCGRVKRTNTSRWAPATCPVAGRDIASVSTQAKLYVIPVWLLTRWMDFIRAWKVGWSGRFRVVLEGRTRVVLRNILIRAGHLSMSCVYRCRWLVGWPIGPPMVKLIRKSRFPPCMPHAFLRSYGNVVGEGPLYLTVSLDSLTTPKRYES